MGIPLNGELTDEKSEEIFFLPTFSSGWVQLQLDDASDQLQEIKKNPSWGKIGKETPLSLTHCFLWAMGEQALFKSLGVYLIRQDLVSSFEVNNVVIIAKVN